MFIFLGILVLAFVFLYVNLKRVADGTCGKLIALGFLFAIFGCMWVRSSLVGEIFLTFIVIWLCQALWMFLVFDIVRTARCLKHCVNHTAMKDYHLSAKRFVKRGARITLALSVLFALGLIAYGVPHNYSYKVRAQDIAIDTPQPFTAVYFSDIHMDPLFMTSKLNRMVTEIDSIKPDFVLFGGDLADVPPATLDEWGYDSLFKRIASSAQIASIAINGNHEAMQEEFDPEGWMRKVGFIVLDDSIACVPAENPRVCFTGRTDFQVARARDIPRKPLEELVPPQVKADSTAQKIPWILMDHQPKGIEPGYSGILPDFALSGHTHDGQFFPGNLVIKLVWRLACGFGTLDGVNWLVSSGIDSWGPPVRAGSDTELWILRFRNAGAK